jgi:lipopolysaccharide/colanic/teichoic acid biosynthesis glycosyltransferase
MAEKKILLLLRSVGNALRKLLGFGKPGSEPGFLPDDRVLYDTEAFSERMHKEIRSSYRTGLPLSYSVMKLGAVANAPEEDREEFLAELLHLMVDNTREDDLFCVNLSEYQLEVLLLNTAIDGAKVFTQKTTQLLYNHFESLRKTNFLDLLAQIEIASYPLNKIAGSNKIVATPAFIKDLEMKKDHISGSEQIFIKRQTHFFLNWDIASASDGVIVHAQPMLWTSLYLGYSDILYQFFKRLVDILGAVTGLILFSPLFLISAIAIKLTSKGPVFFKQPRLGKGGVPFTFYKFRTMNTSGSDQIHRDYIEKYINGEAEEANQGSDEKPVYKITSDPRITPAGRILRRTSLDELPQFINVLLGQMSLVGPRPPIPYEVEMYKEWHLRRILEIKPGITGMWQVGGRNETTFDQMVRMDIQYVNTKSMMLDIRIILKTFQSVFFTHGGY